MNDRTRACLEQHLPDKARRGTVVPASAWFDAAHAHVVSAAAIVDADPAGAAMLGWSAMHKTAKALAAAGGYRVDHETHGKVVDFLTCVFPDLSNLDRGLVRAASTGRNLVSYDDPRAADPRVALDILDLAGRLLSAAREDRPVAPSRRRIPPPPAAG